MTEAATDLDLQALVGHRKGPYCSFNAVSEVQIWQWCTALGDDNPLYLDRDYRSAVGYERAVAPPAMMQMWTMRDVRMRYAPGSTDAAPYEVFDLLKANGVAGNVAVSYDITFHELLLEGDRAHHYTTIVSISDLKKTALGAGYFVTERVEYLTQDDVLFAEALITYFQYTPAEGAATGRAAPQGSEPPAAAIRWHSDFSDLPYASLSEGDALPELEIPITHKLIVSGAVATQDFIDVHHNAPAAREAGMPDIFMNILATSGLCARYLTDWAGPASRLRTLKLNLLAPNTPGDTMVMQGTVKTLSQGSSPLAGIEFAGRNRLGFHVNGSATLAFPG